MTRWAGAAKHNSRLFSAYVCLLGVNVFSCCVVALQHILCDNRPGTGRPGRGGVDGTLHVCGIYIFTWTHIHVYMHVCVCLGPSVTREMDVLASSESPAGGEASEAAPWQ